MSASDGAGGTFVSASCPGGMARQFRVQVSSSETPSCWKLVESFRDQAQADRCVERLKDAGQAARIIACGTLPTAA